MSSEQAVSGLEATDGVQKADPDPREQMRAQIQSIAYDGVIQAEEPLNDPGTTGFINDFARAMQMKLQRICDIAEAGEPDEDWRPSLDAEAV